MVSYGEPRMILDNYKLLWLTLVHLGKTINYFASLWSTINYFSLLMWIIYYSGLLRWTINYFGKLLITLLNY